MKWPLPIEKAGAARLFGRSANALLSPVHSLSKRARIVGRRCAQVAQSVDLGGAVGIPAGEVGSEDEAVGADGVDQQLQRTGAVHVGIQPEAP